MTHTLDMNAFLDRLKAESKRLEKLGKLDADWASRSDGRASGLMLAASLVSHYAQPLPED